jgi:hypothetical protein
MSLYIKNEFPHRHKAFFATAKEEKNRPRLGGLEIPRR